jgi:hypothetical protein
MRHYFLLALLLCGLCVTVAQAAENCAPAPTNILGEHYPCVYPDNRATFEIHSIKAGLNIYTSNRPERRMNGLHGDAA